MTNKINKKIKRARTEPNQCDWLIPNFLPQDNYQRVCNFLNIPKENKNIAQGYAFLCQAFVDNQLFKCCYLWASSIMANAFLCRGKHPSSILGSSTATNSK